MVETEFFLHLLVRLFADPSRLDSRGERDEIGVCGQVGEVVFALAGDAVLTDDPRLFARQVLLALVPDTLRRAVSDADADGGELRPERPFGAGAPAELRPGRVAKDGLGRDRQDVGDGVLARPTSRGPGNPSTACCRIRRISASAVASSYAASHLTISAGPTNIS